MAQSKSLLTGQVASYCQYCETEKKIQYRCLECTLLLCEPCKRNHHKIKSAQNHHIVDISEVGQHDLVLDSGSIPCVGHSGQTCCLFCKTCDKLVCPICVAKTHQGHVMIEIKEAHTIKKEMLKKKIEQTNQKRQYAKTKQRQVLDLKEQKIRSVGKTRVEILDNEKRLKKKVEILTKKLLEDLNQSDANVSKDLEKDSTALENYQSKIEGKNKEMETLVASLNGSEFFQNVDGLIKSSDDIKEPKINLRYSTSFHFEPHELTTVGEVMNNQTQSDYSNFELTDVKGYTTGLKASTYIVPYDKSDNLLIYDGPDKVLQNIQLTGDTVKVLSIMESIGINGMAAFNDNILLSTSRLQLYDIRNNTMRESRFDVSPLLPSKPHITKNNKIILGAINRDYPKPGRRVLIIMDDRGNKEAVIEHGDNNRPIFASPAVTTTTANGYIHVCDWDYVNEPGGRVIVLDQKGRVVTRYNGHPDVNSKMSFHPEDIITLPNDSVVVADCDNHHLHILNNRGELLSLCNTAEKGILLPHSLAVCDSRYIFIGCKRYKEDEKTWGKLYKAELVLF